MSPRVEEPLAGAVRAAGWHGLLPPGATPPPGLPTLRDSLRLGDDLWLVLAEAGDGSVRCVPVVHADHRVRRAEPGDGAAQALVAVIAGGRAEGAFTVTPLRIIAPVKDEAPLDDPATGAARPGSVLVGGTAAVHWESVAAPGPHPATAMMWHLAESGFAGTPRPWGMLHWQPPTDPAPRLLARVEAHVPVATDGWTWAVDDIRAAVAAEDLGVVHRSGTSLGEVVAGFHLALAATAGPSTADDVARWRREGLRDLDDALAATHSPYEPGGGEAYALLRRHEAQLRSLLALPVVAPGPPVMLTHGDLHVGRVLRSGRTLRVTGVETSPAEPTAAAVDVATLAQSLVHAGLLLRRREPDRPPTVVAEASRAFVAAFLTAYGITLADGLSPDLLDDELLHPMRVRQVLRALTYAATHRATGALSPLEALPDLLG